MTLTQSQMAAAEVIDKIPFAKQKNVFRCDRLLTAAHLMSLSHRSELCAEVGDGVKG